MKVIAVVCLAVVFMPILLIGASCSSGDGDSKAIEDTIKGYISSYNDSDFEECITYFTDYIDEEDAKSGLAFFRSVSGEMNFQEIKNVSITDQTATVTVVFTIAGEEGTDEMRLKKVNGEWKIVWDDGIGDGVGIGDALEAWFTASPTSGSATLGVQFSDHSVGEISAWAWDFDNDGTTDSTQQSPLYIYETPGTYTVSLTVTGNAGGSDTVTRTDYINISTPRNHVSWDTGYVSLEADDFYIVADGENYYANVEDVDVHSDPGDETYCSLELRWEENGVEMRLNIYFYANQTNWWSNEIRTYDGQVDGDWIYYTGTFFKTNIGTAFNGHVNLQSDEDNDYAGEIHFKNLTLQAF